MGYLDELMGLLGRCKKMARKAGCSGSRSKGKGGGKEKVVRDEQAVSMWKERGSRVCLIMASQLIEMRDYTAATNLLTPLLSSAPQSSPQLRSAIARIYLQAGHIAEAKHHFSVVSSDVTAPLSLKSINAALLLAAGGEWSRVADALKVVIDGPSSLGSEDTERFVAVNNLAVALLSQGSLKEGIQLLEDALGSSPSTIATAEPFLFNLSTMYELRSNTAADKKRDLLVEVAKWAGDGLRTTCLKMPTS